MSTTQCIPHKFTYPAGYSEQDRSRYDLPLATEGFKGYGTPMDKMLFLPFVSTFSLIQ